jgi:hypothetical protein
VLEGTVRERSFRGAQTRLVVAPALAPAAVLTLVVSGPAPAVGQAVTLTIAPADCSLIPGPAR